MLGYENWFANFGIIPKGSVGRAFVGCSQS